MGKKIIVEVGSGSLPVVADGEHAFRDLLDADPNAQYVGVDLDQSELRYGKELQGRSDVKAGRPPNDRISYVNARAESLPFPDASVDEMILRNVLGDPDIPVEEKHAALKEAARVMKKGALLKMIEVYTPLMVHEDDLFSFIDDMEGRPLSELSAEEIAALPASATAADVALSKDVAAADTLFGNQSFVRYYRRV